MKAWLWWVAILAAGTMMAFHASSRVSRHFKCNRIFSQIHHGMTADDVNATTGTRGVRKMESIQYVYWHWNWMDEDGERIHCEITFDRNGLLVYHGVWVIHPDGTESVRHD
jgi:hypothetical protein